MTILTTERIKAIASEFDIEIQEGKLNHAFARAIEAAVLSANAGKVDAETYLRERYGAYKGHFAWRELEDAFNAGRLQSQQSPVQASSKVKESDATLTSAPDKAMIDAARRYEIVRKLNLQQFAELYKRNITGEGRFDDLVDQLAIDAGRQG